MSRYFGVFELVWTAVLPSVLLGAIFGIVWFRGTKFHYLVAVPLCICATFFLVSAFWETYHTIRFCRRFYGRFGLYRLSYCALNCRIYFAKSHDKAESGWLNLLGRHTLMLAAVVEIKYLPLTMTYGAFVLLNLVSLSRMALIQPAMLLLGTSNQATLMLSRLLVEIDGWLIASFLDQEREHFSGPLSPLLPLSYAFYRRDGAGDRWQEHVRLLMDYVPVIIVDARTTSKTLKSEVQWLTEFPHGRCRSEMPRAHKKQSRLISEQQILFIVDYDRNESRMLLTSELLECLQRVRRSVSVMPLNEFVRYVNESFGFLYLNGADEHAAWANENSQHLRFD